MDARLFLRSSCARFVLARAASRPDAALPVLPAVLMTVAMPSTMLVLVVQNHPSALLTTYAARLCPLYLAPTPVCLAPSPCTPYLWRPRSGSPPR